MKRSTHAHRWKRFSPLQPLLVGGCILFALAGILLPRAFLSSSRLSLTPTSTQLVSSSSNAFLVPAQRTATPTLSGTAPGQNIVFGTPTATSTTGPGTATPSPTLTPTPTSTPAQGTPTPMPTATQGTPTYTPTATQATPTPTPSSGGNPNVTLSPGSALPSESTCAARVTPSPELRPDNTAANQSVPTAAQIANMQPWDPSIGLDGKSDSLRTQITGNYTGTTDEILQWVACKWGVDADIVRAEAVQESNWHQSQLGDSTTNQSLCPPGAWNGSSCYQSYGILQIKYTYFKTEWPMSRQDTAFNAEFVYGWIRNCYEGWADYLSSSTPSSGYPSYHAGDIWGCLGFWFSGGWYTSGAINYISIIKQDYQQKPWLHSGF